MFNERQSEKSNPDTPYIRSALVSTSIGAFIGEEIDGHLVGYIDAPDYPPTDYRIQTSVIGTEGAKEAMQFRSSRQTQPVEWVQTDGNQNSKLPAYHLDDDEMKMLACLALGENQSLAACILLSEQPGEYAQLIAAFDDYYDSDDRVVTSIVNRVWSLAYFWPFQWLKANTPQFRAIEKFMLTGDASEFTKENGFASTWLTALNRQLTEE